MKPLFLAIFCLTLFSCHLDFDDNCFDGSIESRDLDLSPIKEIELEGDYTLILKEGPSQIISIEGKSDLLDNFENNSRVSNGIWKCDIKKHCIGSYDMLIVATIPGLKKISADGDLRLKSTEEVHNLNENFTLKSDGDLHIDLALIMKNLNIQSNGDASISLEGSCDLLSYDFDGDVNVSGHNFICNEAYVAINGDGNIKVNATKKLTVKINGDGIVCYKSHPELNLDLHADGRVENCN